MNQLVVGSVQLNMRLPQSLDEVERNFLRFLRMAQGKRVRLLVFPAYTGLLTAAPILRGVRTGLLKQADQARRRNASFWTRARARLAGGAASVLRAEFWRSLEGALLQEPDLLWQNYLALFSELAKEYTMTVVAGSHYLLDPSDRAVRHMALVFGPDGEILGQQAAVTLPTGEHPLVEEGRRWQTIETPAGRLGILVGNDALYPEPGRLLAYAGAEILIGLGACTSPLQYQRQRQGLLARVEENQLYGVSSFAVGYNPFTPGDELPFVGRSLLAAPISMTPRYNGVLVEMGSDSTEGLITAEWNFPALYELWSNDEAPLRAAMPVEVAGPPLAAIYSRKLTIDQATRMGELLEAPLALAEPASAAGATAESAGPRLLEAAEEEAVIALPGEVTGDEEADAMPGDGDENHAED